MQFTAAAAVAAAAAAVHFHPHRRHGDMWRQAVLPPEVLHLQGGTHTAIWQDTVS